MQRTNCWLGYVVLSGTEEKRYIYADTVIGNFSSVTISIGREDSAIDAIPSVPESTT